MTGDCTIIALLAGLVVGVLLECLTRGVRWQQVRGQVREALGPALDPRDLLQGSDGGTASPGHTLGDGPPTAR